DGQEAERGALGREDGGAAIALHGPAQTSALAVLQPVAEPVDRRLGGKFQTPQRRGCFSPVSGPGLGLQFLGDPRGFAFVEQTGRRIAGRGNDGDGAALGAVEQVGHQVLALFPAFGRGPAIVDDDHQRAVAGELGAAAQQRIGQRHDQQRRRQKAQQQKPPGRRRGGLLFIFQAAQQLERRKQGAPGQRRRHPQQPPQQRQRRQRRQDYGR